MMDICTMVRSVDIYDKFSQYYDLIYQKIVNYEREADAIERILTEFRPKRKKTILDIGCGTGGHALILGERGHKVTGIDISPTMIKQAIEKAKNKKVKAKFLVKDMRNTMLDQQFDCAICMFGGLGYILTYEELIQVFSNVKKHLVRDGLFIFEFWNVGGIRPSPYLTWLKAEDEKITLYRLSESNFNARTNILNIDFNFIVIDKNRLVETFSEAHKMKCYTLPEIHKYIEDSGLELAAAYDLICQDQIEFKIPTKETFRIFAVTRKR